MYNENEKKKLSKATIKLLQKSIKDIKADDTKTATILLNLQAFIQIAWNDHGRCRALMMLIMTGMWNMFNREIRK